MKAKKIVRVSLKPYLKDYILSIYGNEQPVTIPNFDRFNDLLQLLLRKTPANYREKEPAGEYLEIYTPVSGLHEKYNSYNYLSPGRKRQFVKTIEQSFMVTFIDFVEQYLKQDVSKADATMIFLERYAIREDPHLKAALIKRLYRSKRINRKFPKREYTFQGQKSSEI